MFKLFSSEIEKKKINANLYISPDLPSFIYSDPLRMNQIVLNLLSNAVKFTPIGGRIDLAVTLEDVNEISIQVCDTGHGMSEEEQKSLFNTFYQADQTSTRTFGGTVTFYW